MSNVYSDTDVTDREPAPEGGKDAAEWLPDPNRCWFAARVVEVRREYDLTIGPREAVVLERILTRCDNTDMQPVACTAGPAK